MQPVRPGDTIEVPDRGYYFGSGPLRMRVTRASGPFHFHHNELWQEVHGPELTADGHPRGSAVRAATVRLSAVKRLNRDSLHS